MHAVILAIFAFVTLSHNARPVSGFDTGVLHVERYGKPGARSIVFIPALFFGGWQWNAQINALASHYDLLIVTLPGFDGRPMSGDRMLMARTAQSLDLLVRTAHTNRPIVVGHSLGGTLAVYFAEHYPHDVTRVIAVEGGRPIAPTQAARDASVARSVSSYLGATPATVGTIIRNRTLQFTITSPADVAAVAPLTARTTPAAVIAWLRAALSLDLTPQLSRIRVPFRVIIPYDATLDRYQGFTSQSDKLAAYQRWAAHAPDHRVTLIAPARHFVMFDQPARFEQALVSALTQ